MSLKGKVVIVTGASSGIGAATAELFAKKGANVVLVGRNITNLQKTEEKCKELNSAAQTLIVQADVTVDAEKIITQSIAKFAKLDVLVNNAGIFRTNNFMESDINELDMLMNTNLRAVHILTKLAVPYLIETQGSIVNVSSVAGLRPFSLAVNYCLTKAALDQFTKCLALELAPKKVRVNSVNPATIDTEIFATLGMSPDQVSEFYKDQVNNHPIGRIGTANEVAEAIVFLASDEASFITGVLLPIDGARSILTV